MELRVIYVDDSTTILSAVKHTLEKRKVSHGGETHTISVETFSNVQSFEKAASRRSTAPHVVLLDISVDGDDNAGLTLARIARESFPSSVIVMFSQFDDAETIVRYMDVGADNFVSKETPLETLAESLFQSFELKKRKESPQEGDPTPDPGVNVRAAGKTMTAIARRIPAIVKSATQAVHVHGETGTGKEVVADLFSDALADSVPFFRVNSGALAPTLLESELFGHKKGAYTGAAVDRVGLLEVASGGWLFLDEVGLLSRSAQMALLRAIENQEVCRLGETKPRKINVRILSATNEDLAQKVRQGEFRADLWQRLREVDIFLPPLRERKDEIEEVASFLVKTMAGGPYVLPQTTVEVFKKYSWSQGNVRELRNCLRAMTEFQTNKVLEPAAIPTHLIRSVASEPQTIVSSSDQVVLPIADWSKISWSELEDTLFVEVVRGILARSRVDSLRKLSECMGVPRATLTRRLASLVSAKRMDQALLRQLGLDD